ncbi:hypothetical protein P171DRAFT_478783 [Karstenula rhodostoma CBS 690.94]|uniref:Uncharacterized protein n=1 Tax=Karstenula rhodostoma CBS 690.94 TaxID=1392251 RepID=A0A9P4UH33_9PLEO|nr:hypothetical protein P171DRAFT_478783 [Karstenula rhodostoma CBS 690.94]
MERQTYSGVDDIERSAAREYCRSPVSSLGEERPKTTYQYSEEEKAGDDHDHGIDWNPGWRNQWPWVGFAGFMTLVVATAMAIAILGVSNHKRVKDWPFERYPIQPNVLLNIANQVQNLGLITMIGQGLAIAWWRKALRGSSLETLHKNHAYSYSFYAIITSGRKFNIVALAALMTKFAVVDSTLFQKATKTVITQQTAYMNSSVTAWIATEWPQNSGGIPSRNDSVNPIKTVDAAWASVIDAYTGKVANGKIHDLLNANASFFDCPYRQECSGHVKGVGLAFDCNTTTEDIDYGLQQLSQQGGVESSYPLWDVSFNTTWATPEKPYASVQLNMLYADTHHGEQPGSCPGFVTRRSCEIRPAVVEYPLTVMTPSEEELAGGNIVTHIKFFNQTGSADFGASLDGEQIDQLKVLEYRDLNEQLGQVSTVGALTYVFNNLYGSSAKLSFREEWDIEVVGSQAQSIFFADSDDEDANRCYYDIDKNGRDDPAIVLLRKLNTLSFVAGLYLNGAPTTAVEQRKTANMPSQTVLTSVTGIVEEYTTNFKYVAGALVATLVTVLLVLPVYWGFWQLGRKVTLGPLEITEAFGAPIITPERYKNSHGDFSQILKEVGDRRVQYGQLKGAPLGQMGIAEPHSVQYPDKVLRPGSSRAKDRALGAGIGAVLGGLLGGLLGGSAKS